MRENNKYAGAGQPLRSSGTASGSLGGGSGLLNSPVRFPLADTSLTQMQITPQARHYAAYEVARRAGIPSDFFHGLKCSVMEDRTVFEISNGSRKQMSFRHISPGQWDEIRSGRFRTAYAGWMGNSAGYGSCRESTLIVPFVGDGHAETAPLFQALDGNHVECRFDLFLSALLTMSRWEETASTRRDVHGRFAATSSVAVRDGFLERPIVDEYGLAFEQALEHLFPTWRKSKRRLRIKLSHDVDHIGFPFRWKTALRHTTHYQTPLNTGRDLLSVLGTLEPAELRAVKEIVLLSSRYGFHSSVYWKASPPGPRDSGYNPCEPRVRQVMEWLDERGVELGVQPGYATYRSPEKLRREVSLLKRVLGDRPLGGRQHYLRWCPESWIDWENCGLAYDSTVGFADRIGFRAGTCIPYRPWLFPLNRRANLYEIPLLAMDRTLLEYMHLSPKHVEEAVERLLERCRAVGGVFTTVWHNSNLLNPRYRALYLQLLEMFREIENYDWRTEKDVDAF